MRTTFYLSQVRGKGSRIRNDISQDIDDEDDLFSHRKSPKIDPETKQQRSVILKWLKQLSISNPSIADGIEDSIVNWFLQSGSLLPKALHLKIEKKTTDLVSMIRTLNENDVLTDDTLNFMTNSVETAPPEELVWSILNDAYNYALKKQSSVIPLTKTIGENPPIILQRNVLNRILKSLGLQRLPNVFGDPKDIIDDDFRNGNFFFALYEKLTGEKVQPVSTAVSQKKAINNTQMVLVLLESKKFIDSSFINCAPQIVSGDQFVFQQLLSMIFYNCSKIKGPITIKFVSQTQTTSYTTENPIPKSYIEGSNLQDGVTLPKLLTSIDPIYSKLPYLLLSPQNDIEKKWNIRKTIEYLQRKPAWPTTEKIDINDLIDGEELTVQALYNGILACYPHKFASEKACKSLRFILGLNPEQSNY
ncbi:hypothetical protein TVAG_478940 [Trichomonas vaginalis G3]|uniref:Calponin-homology (CH) domain-containing protein n=1 Tax=Trichomonas vaginalis (strain ATCC PRA-98 / G3) TaxID=412133 RepID=A2E010_TRIV3|nr:calponin-homology domain, CH-domain family [Trichomonas vaginalis G3]EAY14069.1 hypothetical protein TVAG_478940 [Trichomonas vaginalis G3]KAI5519490.1 calponin-homology domain, CH-domain family [Trichomonas vaginalis G3]|eukprot:XP_001326292.1 hypothetical protein [Trichomonas vaginalis G3]